jgi:Arc/MetJ family transcription regulator
MAKVTIDVDDNLLAKASEALGIPSKRDTVHEALARVVRTAAFEREVEFAKAGGYDDLLDPEIMKQAWR